MQSYRSLILRRLAALPFVVLGVTFVVFVGIDLAPNDPATAVLGAFASPQAREHFAETHGLNDPLPVRYVRFLGELLHGELGVSLVRPEKVSSMIGSALPVTLQLAGLAILIAILIALVFGTIGALNRDGWPDRVVRNFCAAGLAAPDFWLGILAIQFISVKLGLLPSGGYVPFSQDPLLWFESMIMPATVLALPVSAALAAVLRTALIGELDRDYVRTARGLGLSRFEVIGKHVFRNALLAPLTVVGIRAGYLLGGAIIIESIFQIPGLGTMLIEGIRQGDLAPVRAVAIIGAIVFVLVNLVVDLLYLSLNPKIRHARA